MLCIFVKTLFERDGRDMNEAETTIRRMFEAYRDCFNRLDGPGASSHYAAPSFVVKNGGVVRIDLDTKNDYFDSLMARNAAEGDHVWEIAELEVNLPATNGGIVTVRWIARRPDGSVLWDFFDTYVVADDGQGQGWLILGDIVHSPE